MYAKIPSLGFPNETWNENKSIMNIRAKRGFINLYVVDDVATVNVYFPTSIGKGMTARLGVDLLTAKLLIDDYLSKEAGRSETVMVPLPAEVTNE